MRHESQGVQQKRWVSQDGEKTQFRHNQPEKSQRSSRKKSGPFKECKHCGETFQWEHKSSGRLYCSERCYHDAKLSISKERSKCLTCHALVGMTSTASGKMVGVSHSVISAQRKLFGINGGGYKLAAKVVHLKRGFNPDNRKELKQNQVYAMERMKDIRSFRSDFDWSYFWYQEQSRRKWHKLTPEQKHFRGQLQRDTPEKRLKKQKRLNQWKANRRRIDPIYRIIEGFRSRLCSILLKSKKDKTMDLVGCSPMQLRSHLESHFTKQMSWDNYGRYWHVDHIIPVSAFDHTSRKQRQQCWHWTNLRPLQATLNLRKNNKITEPQMSLCLNN